MKIKSRHILWAFKQTALNAICIYLGCVFIAYIKQADATGWALDIFMAFLLHTILFGIELWRTQRRQPVAPKRRRFGR